MLRSRIPCVGDMAAGAALAPDPSPERLDEAGDLWGALPQAKLDPKRLSRERIVAAGRDDPAFALFDLLRTKLIRALDERGWRRVAVTSPTPGCGKSLVATNLAFSFGRLPARRTVLVDLDMRIPSLASMLGLPQRASMRQFLLGQADCIQIMTRVQPNLAVAVSTACESGAGEILQHPAAVRALEAMQLSLRPDVVLYDMPPALACEDVLAFAAQIDGILLVARGGRTKAADIQSCERLFGERVPLLGVVLNVAEDAAPKPYGYQTS